jgi:hypothetical protein
MNFKSVLGSWLGSFVAITVYTVILWATTRGVVPVAGIVLNSVVAGLFFAGLVWFLHLPFGKTPSLLTSVAAGWLFTFLFTWFQQTFSGDLVQMALMGAFGLVIGTGSFFGMNWLGKKQ